MLAVGLVAVCPFPNAALRSHFDAVLQAVNSDESQGPETKMAAGLTLSRASGRGV